MRHERQVLIPGWDQDAVSEARVMVAGCGALGSSLALCFARLGVGHTMLVDPDRLEEHNLENQCYDASDLGKPKAVALKERMLAIDPSLTVEIFVARVQEVWADGVVDYVFSCVDNVAARYFLNAAAVSSRTPLIDAGIEEFRGQVKLILAGRTACQECYETLPQDSAAASCASAPVPTTYVTANILASLQALQFLKRLHGQPVTGYLQADLVRGRLSAFDVSPNPECLRCAPEGKS